MSKELYSFDKPYSVKGINIRVKGIVEQTDFCYIARIEYIHPKDKTLRKGILTLSSEGKNKLNDKISRYLYQQI